MAGRRAPHDDEAPARPLAPTEPSTSGLRGHDDFAGPTLPAHMPTAQLAARATTPPPHREALAGGDELELDDASAPPAAPDAAASPPAAERETSHAAPPEAPRAPATVAAGPRYKLGDELGRGGMGRVVEAIDRRLGRVVALKESLATDLDSRLRFEREVAITALLEHPSIVPVHDAGVTAEGRPYYVMRKLSGKSLDRVLFEAKTLDGRLALLPALLAACDAVAHAHARHVVHRDLKPGNILVGDHGETMVIDWGLAKVIAADLSPSQISRPPRLASAGDPSESNPPSPPSPLDEQLTAVGAVFGTPGFMSPEQARGEALDLRADVYALGSTLYHLLAGHAAYAHLAPRLHDATTVGTPAEEDAVAADAAPPDAPVAADAATRTAGTAGTASRSEPPPPLATICPGAPVELIAIVDKAMAKELDVRYPDAAALAADLRRFLAGQLVAAHRYTRRQRLRLFARRNRAAFLVAAAALTVLLAIAAVSLRRVLVERRAAIAESRLAAAARAQAEARADELLVARAESMVPEDPTTTLSLLKQLPPNSPAWPRARLAALAAYAEGVARGYPSASHRPPVIFEMSPRGDALLVAEEDGRVWLLELAELRRRDLTQLEGRPLGCWLDGGDAVLLSSAASGLSIYTLATGERRPLAAAAPAVELSCAAGNGAAYRDRDGAVWFLPRAAAAPERRPLDEDRPATALSLTYDGAWLAAGSAEEVVVFDRSGAPYYRAAGNVLRIARAFTGQLGVLLEDRVLKLEPAAGAPPVVSSRPTPPFAVEVYFSADHLLVLQVGNHLRAADPIRDSDLPSTPMSSSIAGDGTLIIGLDNGSLWLSNWWGRRSLRTSTVNPLQRLAGQPGSPRLAAWSRDCILIWETRDISPRRLPERRGVDRLAFLDEDTLMMVGEGVHLLDLKSGTLRGDPSLFVRAFDEPLHDPESGDALLHEPITGNAVLVRRATGEAFSLWDKPASAAAILRDGAVALGTATGELAIGLPGALRPHRMEHAIVGLSRFGERGAIALDAAGELLVFEHLEAAPTRASLGEPSSGIIVDDLDGGAIIAADRRLLRWRAGRVSELARLDQPPMRLTRRDRRLVVYTHTHVFILDLDQQPPRTAPQRIGSAAALRNLSDRGRWIIGNGQRGYLTFIDVVTGARWSRPTFIGASQVAISPSGTRVVQLLNSGLALWTYEIPDAPAELSAWLHKLTNATVDANLELTWQTPPPSSSPAATTTTTTTTPTTPATP